MIPKEPIYLLAAAAVMFYAASRLIALALGGTVGRAIGHALPVILLAILAAALGMDALAVDTLTAVAVMCSTMVLGVAMMSSPLDSSLATRRIWPLFLPVGALLWTAGSLGAIDARIGGALLGVGAVIAWAAAGSKDVRTTPAVDNTAESKEAGTAIGTKAIARSSSFAFTAPAAATTTAVLLARPRDPWRFVVVFLSVITAVLGSLATILAARIALGEVHSLTQGMLATMVIGPLLVLPVLGAVSDLAQAGHTADRAINISLSTAILSICVGLPAVAAVHAIKPSFSHRVPGMVPSLTTVIAGFVPMPVPYGVWRCDATVLVIVGLLLLPIGLGRWSPCRLEAILLVLIYVVYLYMISPLASMQV